MSPRLLTPPGRGGVGVLELEGDAELAALEALRPGGSPALGALAAPRLVRLEDDGLDLDEALVLRRPDGALELHVHGSPVLVARLFELLGGEAPSSEGGPMGLAARARALLADAPCDAAARVLLDQAEGALTRALEELDQGLERTGDLDRARAGARELAAAGSALAPLLRPARVVLAGPVNAGKSTLFNALVGERRVVVSGEAGTTRDRIEARALLGPYAVDLVDTAGERSATGAAAEVEARGQAAGRAERATADLVLWLDPDPAAPTPERGRGDPPLVHLVGRADELAADPDLAPDRQAVAPAVDPTGTAALVAERFARALDLPSEPWRPGRPLPFDEASRTALAELALASDRAAWASALGRALGPRR